MPYVYLGISVFMYAASSVFGKIFNKDNESKKDSAIFYNFLLMMSVFIGWGILYALNFSFDANVLWYSVLFAISYISCNIGVINALRYGPTALTSLFISLSLIVTTFWGFIFWGEKVTLLVVIGLAFVVCSIVLCLYSKEKEEKTFSWKWLFYVALGVFGNAGCSIVQRTQVLQYNGAHGNMLMVFATGLCALTYLVLYLTSDKTDVPTMLKTAWWMPVCAGLCSLALNVLVMQMTVSDLSSSLIYPVIGVGGLAVVTVFSLVLFKEKMTWWQWLGVVFGAVSVLLLSI